MGSYVASIILSLFVLLGQFIYIGKLKLDVSKLETKVSNLNRQIDLLKDENENFSVAIKRQNKVMLNISIEKKKLLDRLEEWKSKKPEYKYKIIEKIREVKSNDCKDISNTLNAVSTIKFNSL